MLVELTMCSRNCDTSVMDVFTATCAVKMMVLGMRYRSSRSREINIWEIRSNLKR